MQPLSEYHQIRYEHPDHIGWMYPISVTSTCFILLYVFVCVFFARRNLSADMCSLLYSFLGFLLSMLSYMGGCGMNAIVVVVVGSNMVGTNNMRGKTQQRTIRW